MPKKEDFEYANFELKAIRQNDGSIVCSVIADDIELLNELHLVEAIDALYRAIDKKSE